MSDNVLSTSINVIAVSISVAHAGESIGLGPTAEDMNKIKELRDDLYNDLYSE